MNLRLVLACVLVACGGGDAPLDASTTDGGLADGPVDDASQDGDSALDGSMVDGSTLADGGEGAFRASYSLASPFPESGIFDVRGDRFFVGSLGDGGIRTVDARSGEEAVFFSETSDVPWWTLGMDIDVERQRLWVCAMQDLRELSEQDPPYNGFVWVFDLQSGERVANHALSDAMETGTCTDVALAEDGSAYVVDREHPVIYRVTEAGGPELFVEDSLLDGGLVGQNAAVVLPDQSALLSVIYLPSRLVYVGLEERNVREVEIEGSFFDATPLSGADGMVQQDGDVFVVFGSEVVRVRPTLASWTNARASEVVVPNGMTDAVLTPGGMYLLNGQAVRFALNQEPEPFALVRFDASFDD